MTGDAKSRLARKHAESAEHIIGSMRYLAPAVRCEKKICTHSLVLVHAENLTANLPETLLLLLVIRPLAVPRVT